MGKGDYCLSITRGIYTRVGGHGLLQQFTSGTLYLDDHEKTLFWCLFQWRPGELAPPPPPLL